MRGDLPVGFLPCRRAGPVSGATGGKMAMRAGPEWRLGIPRGFNTGTFLLSRHTRRSKGLDELELKRINALTASTEH